MGLDGIYRMESSKKVIELGFIDKGSGKHESNIVYEGGYCSDHNSKLRSKATSNHDSGLRFLGNIGVGGERGDVFGINGICPCQSATQYKDAIKILIEVSDG